MIAERVITVVYMEPSMSKELLCKFPDASAFGFNYSQSGIWSPLVPRRQASFFTGASPPRKRRRIAVSPNGKLFEEKHELDHLTGLTNFTKKMERKCPQYSESPGQKSGSRTVSSNCLPLLFYETGPTDFTRKMERKCPHCSESTAQKSASRKGWANVLKAASKRFKRTKGLLIKLSSF